MRIAFLVAQRATCLRRSVGAVIVCKKRILATGYNGTPLGITHCDVTGCLREQLKVPSGERHELCRGLHAEQNALLQAALHGISLSGAVLYCTNRPCIICSKMIINVEIERIVVQENYPDSLADSMLAESGINIKVLEPEETAGAKL